MEHITNDISVLKKTSVEIARRMLPVMKRIQDKDRHLGKPVYVAQKTNKEIIFKEMENIVSNAISDANQIINEIQIVAKIIKDSNRETLDDNIHEHINQIPLLGEVWLGDTYGVSGHEGLKRLKESLDEDLKMTDEKVLIANTIRMIQIKKNESKKR